MRYIVTNPQNVIVRRRVFTTDPRTQPAFTARPNMTIHELEDAEGDAVAAQLEAMERGQVAEFDGTSVTIVDTVDAVTQAPFMRQLRAVLNDLPPAARVKVADKLAAGIALDDPAMMAQSLNTFDVSARPARVQKLKADLLTVIGREVARRGGGL